MTDPATPPAAATPPATPPAGDPPATPPATPPARTAAEIELELVKAQLAGKDKEKDLRKAHEDKKKLEEQVAAGRQALRAAGIITGDDPADAKVILENQQREARSKERREAAIERAALKKLIPTGLGEAEADLVLGSVLRAPGVTFDEATGKVSGLDEAFAVLKPTIERLAGKGATPPVPAPPSPPMPGMAAAPPDAEFAGVKTPHDFMILPASLQEKYEAKYPVQAQKFEADFRRETQTARQPMSATPALQPAQPMRR